LQETINQRFEQLLQKENIRSNAVFAKMIGAPKQSVSQWLKGVKISTVNLERILQTFPRLSEAWLLTGKGPMYIEPMTDDDKDLDKIFDIPQVFVRIKRRVQHLQIELDYLQDLLDSAIKHYQQAETKTETKRPKKAKKP
jgi:hypothetical protein